MKTIKGWSIDFAAGLAATLATFLILFLGTGKSLPGLALCALLAACAGLLTAALVVKFGTRNSA